MRVGLVVEEKAVAERLDKALYERLIGAALGALASQPG